MGSSRVCRGQGFTLIELLFCQVLIIGGLVGAWLGGQRYGWLGGALGFLAGFVATSLGLTAVIITAETLWLGGQAYPPCHSGLCRAPSPWQLSSSGGYDTVQVGDEWVLRCSCGRDYVRVGRRFMERLPDGTLKPYMVHRPFLGWRKDTEEAN